MQEIWQRIENWLIDHVPNAQSYLNPPASDEEIAFAEKTMGVRLPYDLIALYKIHNGQKLEGPGLLEGDVWLSLDEVVREWKIWKLLRDEGEFAGCSSEPENDMTVTEWWHPRWIPLTHNGAGDHVCVDLYPGVNGRYGQIFQLWRTDSDRPLIAEGVRAWFSYYADALERDQYQFCDEYFAVIPRDEADFFAHINPDLMDPPRKSA